MSWLSISTSEMLEKCQSVISVQHDFDTDSSSELWDEQSCGEKMKKEAA